MQPRTRMEARIIDAMQGKVDGRTIATVLRIERQWFEHLRTGGMDTWETRDGIKRQQDGYWFDSWIRATGATGLLDQWADTAHHVRTLAECRASTTPTSRWLTADLEERIAKAAIAAAHISAELFTLSLASLGETEQQAVATLRRTR